MSRETYRDGGDRGTGGGSDGREEEEKCGGGGDHARTGGGDAAPGGTSGGGREPDAAGGGGRGGGDGDDDGDGPDAGAGSATPDPSAALEAERAGRLDAEGKLKRALADMQNLSRRSEAEIDKRAGEAVDRLLLDFIGIRDDLARARDALASGGAGGAGGGGNSKADADGLDSILRNVDSLLGGRGVRPIEALGEIFDPGLHEAVSVVADPGLDDGTVTREIRKGYISRKNVLRPTLVEISRKEGEA